MDQTSKNLRIDLKVASVIMREAARNVIGHNRTERYWNTANKMENYREGMEIPITNWEIKEVQAIAARTAPLN